jgi:hypothetical protein
MAKRKEATKANGTKTEPEPTGGKRVQKRVQVYNKKTKRWVFEDSKAGMAILLAKARKRERDEKDNRRDEKDNRERERDEKDNRERAERAVKRVRRVVSEPKIPAPTLLPEEIIMHTGASLEFSNLSLS